MEYCVLPEEKLLVTPSEIDGMDRQTENDLRIYGCELIQNAGILLKLPQVAMATGQVLLQRFYYSKSLVTSPIEHTAMACILLASKIEEVPRRGRDIINVFHHIKQVNSQETLRPLILDQNYLNLRDKLVKAERRILKELGFCVRINHPHKLIVMYLQVLSLEKNTTLMQKAWNYMNDSLRTDVVVRYRSEVIACACIYLTARILKLPLPKSPPWYIIFGVDEKSIQDVCFKILGLYERPKFNIEILQAKVNELYEKLKDTKKKNQSDTDSQNYQSTSFSQPVKTSDITNNVCRDSQTDSEVSRPGNEIRIRSESRSRSRSKERKGYKRKHSKESRSRSPISPRHVHKKRHKHHSKKRHKSRKRKRRSPSYEVTKSRYENKDWYEKDKYEKCNKEKEDSSEGEIDTYDKKKYRDRDIRIAKYFRDDREREEKSKKYYRSNDREKHKHRR